MRIYDCLAGALLAVAAPALAQPTDAGQDTGPQGLSLPGRGAQGSGGLRPGGPPGRPVDDGWSVTVGLAPVVSPAWLGAKDIGLSLFPDLRVAYGDTFFASVPDGVGVNLINRNGWKAGPIGKVRFSRTEENGGSPFLITGGSDALRGMGNVGATAELGGFVEHRFGARRQLRARADVRRGFGGHEGVLADLALSYQGRSGRTIFNIGPRATLASKDFIRTYFGIDGEQSVRSGLPSYGPDGGLLSVGVGGSAVRPLGRRSAITLFGGVDRLGGKAAHSPLVDRRGERIQFTLGLGYGLRFSL